MTYRTAEENSRVALEFIEEILDSVKQYTQGDLLIRTTGMGYNHCFSISCDYKTCMNFSFNINGFFPSPYNNNRFELRYNNNMKYYSKGRKPSNFIIMDNYTGEIKDREKIKKDIIFKLCELIGERLLNLRTQRIRDILIQKKATTPVLIAQDDIFYDLDEDGKESFIQLIKSNTNNQYTITISDNCLYSLQSESYYVKDYVSKILDGIKFYRNHFPNHE